MSALFIVVMGCGSAGSGCGACGAVQPLPAGGLPKTQTIEGGAQIRLTQSGLNKIRDLVPAILGGSIDDGFCVGRQSTGNPTGGFLATGGELCYLNGGGACGAGVGCKVGLSINSLTTSIPANNKIRINVSVGLNTSIPIRGQLVGIGASCTLNVSSNNLGGSVDVALGINPANGELTLQLDQINQFSLNLNTSGCGVAGDILDVVSDILDGVLNSFVGDFIYDLLTPTINNLIQNLLPNPLGLAGLIDVQNIVGGVSPGTKGFLEGRFVPGGYVRTDAASQGLSLGMITGMNADEDPTTRTGIRGDGIPNISEPALCVPPMSPPNFAAAPHSLGGPPDAARGTFFLPPAGAFNGSPEPQADLAMGISETMLDLAGHHLVSSGAMCLGVGTSTIQQLNVGTIGILVPSLSELASENGNDPLLLVTRPQKAIDFKIGDNTPASPAVTLGIEHLEVDFYAFLYERYVRAFTLDLTMNVGINLEFENQPGLPTKIKPTLVGLSSTSVQVKVLNSEFVRETPANLEAVLPSVFDLLTPLLGNLGTIDVPEFAGLSLNNLRIGHVVTPSDDFLALYASLGAGTLMAKYADNPLVAEMATELDAALGQAPSPSHANIHLEAVRTPSPELLRAAMITGGKGMPEVVFAVDRFDAQGQELEYSYDLNGGLMRPYRAPDADGRLIIRDAAFAWQGKYTIGIKSRVKGDYRTTSVEQTTPVIIDSLGPKVIEKNLVWDEDMLRVPMFDIVSEHALTYAFGKPGADEPATAWAHGGSAELSRAQAESLAIDGELVLFAKDEAGNQTIALIAPFHGAPGETGGCASCSTSSGPSKSGIALVVMVGIALFGRRRRVQLVRFARRNRAVANVLTLVGVAAISSLLPACDCGDPAAKACEVAADCGEDICEKGELPFCIDGECLCSSDIIPGRIGAYSDVATGADGSIWVSAYSINYGDLVVAKVPGAGRVPSESWQWVDGIPEGPVLIPDSEIRGGIEASGDDVGMYTSIAVNSTGEPMVTYFDRDSGSLRFSQKVGDTWQKHTVQAGTGGTLGEFSGEIVGMYTSLTLRSDDGRPGVAYLAHIRDTNGDRAEVRYAAAQTAHPTQASDWQLWIVDSAPLAPEDPSAPEVYPLPAGLGLFIDSARLPDQAPVVVYYDRAKGDLKVSKFNPAAGAFGTAIVLDGSTNDAGWSPSVAIDAQGKINVAYVGPTDDDLKFITEGGQPQIVDDGYRIVGQTVDGLPKPEFHFVGDDASLQIVNGLPMIAYQDATTQELLLASRSLDGTTWSHESIAGATDPWPGAYGFFAASSLMPTTIVMSTWVINQPADNPYEDNWVEVFTRLTQVQ